MTDDCYTHFVGEETEAQEVAICISVSSPLLKVSSSGSRVAHFHFCLLRADAAN